MDFTGVAAVVAVTTFAAVVDAAATGAATVGAGVAGGATDGPGGLAAGEGGGAPAEAIGAAGEAIAAVVACTALTTGTLATEDEAELPSPAVPPAARQHPGNTRATMNGRTAPLRWPISRPR